MDDYTKLLELLHTMATNPHTQRFGWALIGVLGLFAVGSALDGLASLLQVLMA